MLIALKV